MRVAFSTAAKRDLQSIAIFISSDSVARAATYVGELEEACLGLGEHPHRYALLPGFEHLAYRRRPVGNYAIIYVVGEVILIVRILHTAMDFAAVLGD